MPQTDWPLEVLREYAPPLTGRDDFDEFWRHTLAENAMAHKATFEDVSDLYGLRSVDVYDVRFGGWQGERVAAWLLMPKEHSDPLPGLVQFIGYGSGRGLPQDALWWSAAGFAHLVVDNRAQGAGLGRRGDTADPFDGQSHYPGLLTRGVHDRNDYYYRRLITDCVQAVQVLAERPDVGKVAVHGTSQGAGLAIAAAALSASVDALVADVPFLCNFERAASLSDRVPYKEIAEYLRNNRDRVAETFETLSYFDAMNFANRCRVPALFSVALMDPVCPPSTVFAAYNHFKGPKKIEVFPFGGHEIDSAHSLRALRFLQTGE